MLSPSVTRRLLDRLSNDRGPGRRHADAAAKLGTFAPRDRDIALAIAEGEPNAAIASSTVKSHVSAILTQLALDSRVQITLMVRYARSTRTLTSTSRTPAVPTSAD
jgi:DNA-binding NarL/FixJ family response regulator